MSRATRPSGAGASAEWIGDAVADAKGYRILGHRLRTPYGEVDLAAWKGGVLVIVEVKARATYDAGAYARARRSRSSASRARRRCWPAAGGSTPRRSASILIVVGAGWLPKT